MPTDHREALLIAAAELAKEVGPGHVRFGDVLERAGVPRATAYRIFPKAYDGILSALHWELVEAGVGAIRNAVSRIEDPITFDRALLEGITALLVEFDNARLTQLMRSRDLDLLSPYLLNRTEGSLSDVLSDYVAGCAASFGCKTDDLPQSARRFVFQAMADVVVDWTMSGAEHNWPDVPQLMKVLRPRVTAFVESLGLDDRNRNDTRLKRALVPLAALPEKRPELTFMTIGAASAA